MSDQQEREQALFLERSKRRLERRANETDVDVLRALRLARSRALKGDQSKSFMWTPARGLVALCVGGLVFFLMTQNPVQKDLAVDFEDIELLASSESFEFYDDLEFYGWLVEEQGAS